MKKSLLVSALLCFLVFSASAQKPALQLNLNYNYSFPIAHFSQDLVSEASPRGFTGNLMYPVSQKISVGLGVGYQDYYEKFGRRNYNLGKSQQVSAVLTNSIQMVPVMARIEVHPLSVKAPVQPYLSLAAGANFINYDQYLGQFSSSSASTGFRGSAGLGIKIPFAKGWGIDVGGSYDFAPFNKFGYKDLHNANVRGGVYFLLK